MIKLNGSKLIGSVINFIDEKSNGAITNLHNSRYIGNLEEYLLYGWVVIQNPSPYLKPILKMDTLIRLSLANRFSKGYSISRDYSVGFTIPVKTYKAIMDGIYSRSNMLKHLDVIKTDSDRVIVPYNNTQGLRWPGEVPPAYRIVDPEPEYIDINTNVALLVFTISSKPNQIRARSIEDDYIESNIETLVEYFDRAIPYGSKSSAKISGLYPKSDTDAPTPNYSYVIEVESFDTDHMRTLKNSLPVKYRKDAAWIMNTDTGRLLSDLLLLDVNNDLPNRILGIPVIYNDYMDSLDSHDSAPVIVVNLKKAYTFTQGSYSKGPSVRRFEEDIRSEKEQIMALSRYRWGGMLTNPDALRVLRIKNEQGSISDNSTSANHIYNNIDEVVNELGSK